MSVKTQYVAGGNILPCRFIKEYVAGTEPFCVIQATENSRICGVSAEGTTVVAIKGYTDDSCIYAATAGLPVSYFGEHDECLLEVGAAVAFGDYLVSDSQGRGVKSASSNKTVGAVALEPATAAGQKIRVRVEYQRMEIPTN